MHSLSVDDGTGFRRLFARAVIREARPGAFYLDEDVLSAVQATRRRMLVVVMALVAILVIALGLGMLPLR
ncbi:MAG TPA: hypothetical protein VGT98_09805 [Candidatus Elarobacter sp.]|nr:hypothetical protein [Candidatus Elarobacter sp.]